jgi:DNA-binding NarL/FixJ family response regulator
MRLVLCDDNRILCEALGAVLEGRGHQVLAIAASAALGIAAVGTHQPDACLLDVRFPDPPDGLAAARVIRRRYPRTAVLMLSGLVDPAVLATARDIGVSGFLRKDHNVDHVAWALSVIAAGGRVFDRLPPRAAREAAARQTGLAHFLTPREKEVLSRIVAGQGSVQMSAEMNISASTLRSYIKNVFAKLGTHSRLEAAAIAVRENLLAEEGI